MNKPCYIPTLMILNVPSNNPVLSKWLHVSLGDNKGHLIITRDSQTVDINLLYEPIHKKIIMKLHIIEVFKVFK